MNRVFKMVGIGLAISGFLASCVSAEDRRQTAEAYLNAYSINAGYTPFGCSGMDSDNDGYVSCDANDSVGNPVYLECAYNYLGSGCKRRPPTIVAPY